MAKRSNPTKDFYNKNAANWASRKGNSFFHEPEFRKFITYFKNGNSILDIGCAYGIHVPLFLGIGHKLNYEGIDITIPFLKVARAHYPQLSFKETDLLDKKSFPKKKFHGFWAAAVLMHIPAKDWPLMLENIERVMKPRAVGYITLPRERFTKEGEDPRHFEIFDTARLKKMIGTRGWKILKSGHKESTATTDWLWYIVQLP